MGFDLSNIDETIKRELRIMREADESLFWYGFVVKDSKTGEVIDPTTVTIPDEWKEAKR